MRPTTKVAGYLVAVIVVVMAIIVLIVHAHGTQHSEARVATTSPNHRTTSSSSVSPATTTDKPSGTSSSQSTPPPSGQLIDQVGNFLQAYYLIKPDDTEATRRDRIAPLVPAPFLSSLDLSLATGTTADEARIQDKLTIQAQVESNQLIAEPIDGNQSIVTVTVPVTVETLNPDGSLVQAFEVATTSKWQYQTGKWTILSFT